MNNFVDTLENITVGTEELLTGPLADVLSCLQRVVQQRKVAEKRGFNTGRSTYIH